MELPPGKGGDGGVGGFVPGKWNVITRYSVPAEEEFVRWQDGQVAFTVFDGLANAAEGIYVKGLPGIKDPNKVYGPTNSEGIFLVPKEDLPEDLSRSARTGSASVIHKVDGDDVTEESAPNAYVPTRVHVRIRLLDPDITLDGSFMIFKNLIVERRDGEHDWQRIPSYLEGKIRRIYAFPLSNSNANPASFSTEFSYWFEDQGAIGSIQQPYTSNQFAKIDITSDNNLSKEYIRIFRLRKRTAHYIPPANPKPGSEWVSGDHFFTLVLGKKGSAIDEEMGYYGETPYLDAVIQMAPVQAMPLISGLTASNYRETQSTSSEPNYFDSISGSMNMNTPGLDRDLFFRSRLGRRDITAGNLSYSQYYTERDTGADNLIRFSITFMAGNHNDYAQVNGAQTEFKVLTPRINAHVHLHCTTHHFHSLDQIGYFGFASGGSNPLTNPLIITNESGTYREPFTGWQIVFPNGNAPIPVSYLY